MFPDSWFRQWILTIICFSNLSNCKNHLVCFFISRFLGSSSDFSRSGVASRNLPFLTRSWGHSYLWHVWEVLHSRQLKSRCKYGVQGHTTWNTPNSAPAVWRPCAHPQCSTLLSTGAQSLCLVLGTFLLPVYWVSTVWNCLERGDLKENGGGDRYVKINVSKKVMAVIQ